MPAERNFKNTTLSEEYALIANAFGYHKEDLIRFARNAFLSSGADLKTKQNLLKKFDEKVLDLQ